MRRVEIFKGSWRHGGHHLLSFSGCLLFFLSLNSFSIAKSYKLIIIVAAW